MINNKSEHGFTIVELLVVIVVIGILAAITVVSYTGISQKATAASLQSDLNNASKQLKLFQVVNDSYPTTTDCAQPNSTTNQCVKTSNGSNLTYQVDNTSGTPIFAIYESKNGINYRITSESAPKQVSIICPINFIIVPGNSAYSTSDFCVMKYEAKQVGTTTTPTSIAKGEPWHLNQPDAITDSANVTNCTGCHLTTENEWLTIAQNIMSVTSNWSGGSVGNGYIFSGHNDGTPASSQAADINDSNGYINTSNSSASGTNQRRTLALSNGEIIWDFAGNVGEWTQGIFASSQQPGLVGDSSRSWKEWNNGALLLHGQPSLAPSFGTPAASSWTSTHGIGQMYTNYNDTISRSSLRGGTWYDNTYAGIYSLKLMYDVGTGGGSDCGFRVAK